jgi:TRAP-type C4-dicarboxylate transport system permease small subunit
MTDHPDVQTPGLKLGEAPPRITEGIERVLTAAIMCALLLITFANVLVRYLTNVSFAFTEEYSVALMVILTLVGTSAAFAGNRHIRLTFLVEKLALTSQRRIEIAVLVVCLVMFLLVGALGARYTWDEYRFDALSPGLGIPQWRYTVALPIVSLAICLRILGRLVRVLRLGS